MLYADFLHRALGWLGIVGVVVGGVVVGGVVVVALLPLHVTLSAVEAVKVVDCVAVERTTSVTPGQQENV